MRRAFACAAVMGGLFAAAAAHAATVDVSVAAAGFSNAIGGQAVFFHNNDAIPGNEVFGYGNPATVAGPTTITFAASGSQTVSQGADFSLGTLTTVNTAITSTSELTGLTFSITPSLIFGGKTVTSAASFNVNYESTPNQSNIALCKYASTVPCADAITVTRQTGGTSVFDINGQQLTLFIDGFEDSSGKIGSTDIVQENATTAVQLIGRFDLVSSAPEPASWMLALAGMGFVGAAMRMRRTALTS